MTRRSTATVVAALTLTACGPDGPDVAVTSTAPPSVASPPPTADAPADVEVEALDNTFRPNQVTVAPGTAVHFVNRGRNDHNVRSPTDASWGADDAQFGPGAEYVHVFEEPGEYRYYCSLHGTADFGMKGVIVVQEVAG